MDKPSGQNVTDAAATTGVHTSQRTAAGNDGVTTQQQSMPSVDALKGKWKQQVDAAKIAWDKLTADELLTIEGHPQRLAGLVQERYAITRGEADEQVKAFFDRNKS